MNINHDLRGILSKPPPVHRYEVNLDCKLITVGELFKTSFYAFAFERGQKSEQLRKRVNKALLEMHDTGAQQVEQIKQKVDFWAEIVKKMTGGTPEVRSDKSLTLLKFDI